MQEQAQGKLEAQPTARLRAPKQHCSVKPPAVFPMRFLDSPTMPAESLQSHLRGQQALNQQMVCRMRAPWTASLCILLKTRQWLALRAARMVVLP